MRGGTSTCPGPPAGPTVMRPSTPILITTLPPTKAHSRAARTNVPWYLTAIAPLLVLLASPALLLVAPMVSVEAPVRILISGQSMSCAAPATDCCDVAVEREKKPEILSVNEDELDAGGVPAAGADGVVPRRLPPEQPDASSARKNTAE